MNATALSMTCNNLLLPIVQITTIALLIALGMYNELFDSTIWPNISYVKFVSVAARILEKAGGNWVQHYY